MNLMRRIEIMGSKLKPLYVDVTSNPRTKERAFEICDEGLLYCGVNVMLHVVCAEETKGGLKALLESAKKKGIRNLMVLRGDTTKANAAQSLPQTSVGADFNKAADMIRFVRQEFGDWFCIACACYPEGQDSKMPQSYENDLLALVEKVQAGADFCVTQLFFDTALYAKFVKDARFRGVNVPIVPGLMPIQLYKVFDRTTKYLGTKVPESVLRAIEPIKDDDAAVRQYGIDLAEKMSRELLAMGAPGIHFFTLNLERTVTTVIERLDDLLLVGKTRGFPWRTSAHEKRSEETVRPIFWSNKPKSYVERTQAWDEFPNGRWGNSSSPAYGEFKGSHYYATPFGTSSDRRVAWGESPLSVAEIAKVFVGYVEGTVDFLPWSESGLALETGAIRDALVDLNLSGFLTINSQPRVNGIPSDDKMFGWGPENGYVYQKAYVEFFVCEQGCRALLEVIEAQYPTLDFHALNCKGKELKRRAGGDEDGPCAVTWGVFPSCEVLQPTIVDPTSFVAWKDEAFEQWTEQWANVYSDDSPSHSLIWTIHDSFWLVNLVDNDFVRGDIFKVFQEPSVRNAAGEGLRIVGGV